MKSRLGWHHITEKPIPSDQTIIGITDFMKRDRADWITIGKRNANHNDSMTSSVGYAVHPIVWWKRAPDVPVFDDGEWLHSEYWLSCAEIKPPQTRDSTLDFILFDEKEGIAEAYIWGDYYQSDTCSCKHYFKKPLFWRPFPILPIRSVDILQWDNYEDNVDK